MRPQVQIFNEPNSWLVKYLKPGALFLFAEGKAKTARAGKEKFPLGNLLVPIPVAPTKGFFVI